MTMKLNMSRRRRQKISFWLNEDFIDYIDKLKWERLIEAGYWLSEKLNEAVCFFFGHEVIDDQCGISAHRYCAWCNRSTPNQELAPPWVATSADR